MTTDRYSQLLVGYKPGTTMAPLLDAVRKVAGEGASVHIASYVMVGKDGDEPERQASQESELTPVVTQLSADGYEATQYVAIISVAAGSELAREASARGADLILAGLTKRSRVGKALLGSDAQAVLLGAPCPVLAIRAS